jgi:hypothetical protein
VKTFQVRAAAPGKVIYIGWDQWSGNTMVISHDVGGKKDVYRTIYMHLQNGPANDCDKAWTKTIPTLNASDKALYTTYLENTGCPLNKPRNPDSVFWGKESQKINMSLLGQTVSAGQAIAWAGSTGPGGCGCMKGGSGPNTHLHVFFAHRDPIDNLWYFFDPYGIYSYPACYPTAVDGVINTACSRYPVSWKNGSPQFPTTAQVSANSASVISSPKENSSTRSIDKLLIYPNPSAGNITVEYNSINTGTLKLAVHDMKGQAVFSKIVQVIKGANTYYLNIHHLPSAVYYLELNSGGEQIRRKFLVVK